MLSVIGSIIWANTPVFTPKLTPLETLAERALRNPTLYSGKSLSKIACNLQATDPNKKAILDAAQKVALNRPVKIRSGTEETDTTKYDLRQGSQNPEDFIAVLKQNGASITSIEINMPTDDVFQALVDYCPNITTLSYNNPGMNVGSYQPTNAGLLKISELSKLTSLRICVDDVMYIDESGITALLSSSVCQNQLEHLYIASFVKTIDDSNYSVIASCKNLKTLYLNGNILKAETLEKYPLPSTLTHLTFTQYPYPGLITDSFLNTLPSGMTSLKIYGSWKDVSAEGFSAMLQRMSGLKELALEGEAVSSAIVLSITTELDSLSLGDTSQLSTSDFVTITNNQPSLKSYSIGKAVNFNQFVPLPSTLKSLSIDAPKLYMLSAIPNTLEELTMMNVPFDYTYFSALSAFKSLHTLRIRKCLGFNDAALIPIIEAIKHQVRFIELNNVSITLHGAMKLAECPKLQTLILNRLFAFSANDLSTLLNNVNLRQRIVNLYIGMIELNNENLGPILSSFTKLKDLFLMLSTFALPKNFTLKTQTIGSFWLGPPQLHKFIQLQK